MTAAALVLVSASPVGAQQGPVSVDMRNATGQSVGTATLTQAGGGVELRVQVRGLPPGDHGIHLHAVGACDGPEFTSAGGHFNPTGGKHGLQSAEGPHAGDLPNLQVAADGSGALTTTTNRITLGAGATSVFDADGTALVIHAGPDDNVTDPAGNSGARIACGLVARGGAAGAAPAAQTGSTAPQLPRTGVGAPLGAGAYALVGLLLGILGVMARSRRR